MGLPLRPSSHVQQPLRSVLHSRVKLGPQPEKTQSQKTQERHEKGGIQTATVRAPGRRSQGVKNRDLVDGFCPQDANWSFIIRPRSPQSSQVHGHLVAWASVPGPVVSTAQAWIESHPALRFPGEDWQLLGSSQSSAQVSAVLLGEGRVLLQPCPSGGSGR